MTRTTDTRPGYGPMGMVREIALLAGGTLARLAKNQRYDAIDAYRDDWIQWVARQPALKRWPSWVECHEEYARFRAGGA